MKSDCEHKEGERNNIIYLFPEICKMCALVFCFDDDSSITVEANRYNNVEVASKFNFILSKLEVLLKLNNLKLNVGKAVIIRLTTRQQLVVNGVESLVLDTKNDKGENFIFETIQHIVM